MQYKKTTLSNGLRILTIPMKNTETVTVIIMVGVGSRYETEKEAGLSHFIEHMMFKGTEKRPTTLDISETLDSIGGEFNAFTGSDRTAYYAKVDAKHMDVALDVISDIFLNSKMEEKEIEKEKGTIIQEINMFEDTPMADVEIVLGNLLYKKNPLGRYPTGSKKTVSAFKKADFIGYLNRFYVANDTVLCIAGNFNEKKTLDLAKKYFSGMKKGIKPKYKRVKEIQSKPELALKYKNTDQTHLLLGNRAFNWNHKDRFALGLLAVILGGNMSSRLFIEVREKRGLAYHVRTSVDAFEDCGYIATQAGVNHDKLELTVKTILDEYRKISTEKVSKKELQKAKDYIKGKSVMNFESSDDVAMFFVDQEVKKKKIMALDEIFKKIDKVSEGDILRVAKEIFQNKKLNLAIIGPHKNEEKIKKLLNIC
ncbi:MAG: pitrilysin family protein [Patescibacteria group bacterium]